MQPPNLCPSIHVKPSLPLLVNTVRIAVPVTLRNRSRPGALFDRRQGVSIQATPTCRTALAAKRNPTHGPGTDRRRPASHPCRRTIASRSYPPTAVQASCQVGDGAQKPRTRIRGTTHLGVARLCFTEGPDRQGRAFVTARSTCGTKRNGNEGCATSNAPARITSRDGAWNSQVAVDPVWPTTAGTVAPRFIHLEGA